MVLLLSTYGEAFIKFSTFRYSEEPSIFYSWLDTYAAAASASLMKT